MLLSEFTERDAEARGLKTPRLIYTGRSYGPEVTSLLFSGMYDGNSANMKVLLPGGGREQELTNITRIGTRLESDTIAVPRVFLDDAQASPLYFIYERIEGTRLFSGSLPEAGFTEIPQDPLTTRREKEEAVWVYATYQRDWARMAPFISPPRGKENTAGRFTEDRVKGWYRQVMEAPLLPSAALKQCMTFLPDLVAAFGDAPLEFQHGHFWNEHIIRSRGKYYLLDFAHCSWRPRGYDLATIPWNLSFHNCWPDVRPERWLQEMKDWEEVIRRMLTPEDFEQFRINMTERAMGSILMDIGFNAGRLPEERQWLYDVWKVLFDHYIMALPSEVF